MLGEYRFVYTGWVFAQVVRNQAWTMGVSLRWSAHRGPRLRDKFLVDCGRRELGGARRPRSR
ncbi:hypothetical protein GCM10022380_00670 [Amycolatopsis tucumanensis]|uniref:Uncharacterized protein n=1 Tax=Amycolatopsis tucumanensis TaxID=401106 RepID=A0ABP7H8N9_9PSEU